MPPKAHAILSASSSHRWLHCPPSARLCETYEDKGSDYAAEGTDAHSLREYKLRIVLGMEATDPTEHLTWYNEEMLDCANGYAAYILGLVEGRSNRRYTDEAAVTQTGTNAGFDPYERKLLGITAMQKLLGKSRFDELLSAYIEKPQGKPTLVPESDKRPVMNNAKTDFMEENDYE